MSLLRSPGTGRIGPAVAAAILSLAVALGGCGDGGGGSYTAADLATGEEVSVTTLRGGPALLVSWATWCRECDEELAGLQEFAESEAAEGLQIVAVNLDAASVEEEIAAKVAEHGLTVDLWRDERNRFKREFGALGVPTTVLLDAQGDVAGTFPGAIDFEQGEVLDAIDEVRERS